MAAGLLCWRDTGVAVEGGSFPDTCAAWSDTSPTACAPETLAGVCRRPGPLQERDMQSCDLSWGFRNPAKDSQPRGQAHGAKSQPALEAAQLTWPKTRALAWCVLSAHPQGSPGSSLLVRRGSATARSRASLLRHRSMEGTYGAQPAFAQREGADAVSGHAKEHRWRPRRKRSGGLSAGLTKNSVLSATRCAAPGPHLRPHAATRTSLPDSSSSCEDAEVTRALAGAAVTRAVARTTPRAEALPALHEAARGAQLQTFLTVVTREEPRVS